MHEDKILCMCHRGDKSYITMAIRWWNVQGKLVWITQMVWLWSMIIIFFFISRHGYYFFFSLPIFVGLLLRRQHFFLWKACRHQWLDKVCTAIQRQLREWESVGIRLRSLRNAACLPLLCQGSKWLSGKSVWTSIQKVLGSNPSFSVDLFFTLSTKTSSQWRLLDAVSSMHSLSVLLSTVVQHEQS